MAFVGTRGGVQTSAREGCLSVVPKPCNAREDSRRRQISRTKSGECQQGTGEQEAILSYPIIFSQYEE